MGTVVLAGGWGACRRMDESVLTTFTLATCRVCVFKGQCGKGLELPACFDAANMHQMGGTEGLGPELVAVLHAWPSLPNAIKAGILAMVKAVLECEKSR